MTEFLQYVVIGITTGALYVLVTQGLVVVYRGSGILNFAQGAFVMTGAYAYYQFRVVDALPAAAAVVLVGVIGAVVGVLTNVLVIRRMRSSSPLTRVVATLGVLVVLESIATLRYGATLRSVPSYLPTRSVTVVSGISIGLDRIIITGICVVTTGALWAVYRHTSFGRITDAVAENEFAAAAQGHSPGRTATINWALGGALGAIGGTLLAPILFLQPIPLATLIIPALAAALLGGFKSFPYTAAAAVVIGVLQDVGARYITTTGLAAAIPFLVVIVVMVARGRGLPVRSHIFDRLPAYVSGRIRRVPTLTTFVVLAVLILTVLPVAWIGALTVTISWAMLCLSIVVVTGMAGQLSLASYITAGVTALATARLCLNAGWSFLPAMAGAVVIAMVLGVVVGLPALRTRGIDLAIVTFCTASVIFAMVLNNSFFAGDAFGLTPPSLSILGYSVDPLLHPDRYGVLAVAVLALLVFGVSNLRRGAAGRRLLAVRANERAAAASGVNIYAAKIFAFAISSGIAGLGGVLLTFRNATILPSSFDVFSSINVATSTVVGGVGSPGGAAVGSLLQPGGLVAQAFSGFPQINSYLPLIGGSVLILVLLADQDGLLAMNRKLLSRAAARVRPARATRASSRTAIDDDAPSSPGGRAQVDPKVLCIRDMTVSFGPLAAVEAVSLEVRPGQIHGLIGPNGAGKTTFIDGVTGFVKVASGEVLLGDANVTSWSSAHRVRAGLSRSFQSLELFEDLTVLENIAVASDSGSLRRYARDMFWPGRTRLTAAGAVAVRELALDEDLAKLPTELPFGKRRMVGIARAIASNPSVLLLDEPASGLDDVESEELARLIKRLAQQRGMAVLLIEHNVEMVLDVCDTITVMDEGRKLVTGSPDEIRSDPLVLSAYLGTSKTLEPHPSGADHATATVFELERDFAARTLNGHRVLPSATGVVLEGRGLGVGYGDVVVGQDLDITLAAGEILALLGPNGAGKSTILHTLAGTIPALGGEVLWLGARSTAPTYLRARQGLSVVPEGRSVLRSMSTRDNLKIGPGGVHKALAIFPDLEPLLRRPAGLLSGGEQQMLALARALAAEPRVLLVDELSLGLAPIVVDRLLRTLTTVARRDGVAVLLVEQQAKRALTVADRWLLLRRGQIVQEGDRDSGIESFESAYLAGIS